MERENLNSPFVVVRRRPSVPAGALRNGARVKSSAEAGRIPGATSRATQPASGPMPWKSRIPGLTLPSDAVSSQAIAPPLPDGSFSLGPQ